MVSSGGGPSCVDQLYSIGFSGSIDERERETAIYFVYLSRYIIRCVPAEASLTTHINGLTVLTNRVYADLTRSLQLYDDLFQK